MVYRLIIMHIFFTFLFCSTWNNIYNLFALHFIFYYSIIICYSYDYNIFIQQNIVKTNPFLLFEYSTQSSMRYGVALIYVSRETKKPRILTDLGRKK